MVARKTSDFDDGTIIPGSSNFRKEHHYKLEQGVIDVVRFLSGTTEFNRHWIPERRLYINCCLDDEKNTSCPVCDAGYEPQKRWAVALLHLSRTKNRKQERVGKVMVWVLNATTYCQLRDVRDMFGDLKKLYLRVSPTDAAKQLVGGFYPLGENEKVKPDKEMVEAVQQELPGMVDKFLEIPTIAKAKQMLEGGDDDFPGVDGGGDVVGDDLPLPQTGQRSRPSGGGGSGKRQTVSRQRQATPPPAEPEPEQTGDGLDELEALL